MATPNKTQLALQHTLRNTVKKHGRYLRELKTPQQVGADIVQVQGLPNASITNLYGPFSFMPSTVQPINVMWTPDNQELTLWQPLVTLWVDPPAFDPGGFPDGAYVWPDGGALDSGQSSLNMFSWWDYFGSNDTTNQRYYKTMVYNYDSSDHVIYLAEKVYLPNLNQDML